MRRLHLLVACLLFLLLLPGAAFGKSYSAQRFDVTLRPLDDGTVQVTETLRLTFDGGPFTHVSRDISLKKTDGIEILGASMDGKVLRRGTEPGQFEVRAGNARLSVRWRFPAVTDSAHDFRVSYLARGVVQQTEAGPILEWQAHPTEHSFRIVSSRIVVDGLLPDREPALRTRRVAETRASREPHGWVIQARDIGSNGWVMISTPTTVAAGIVPKWQQRERAQRALAPRLLQFAALATVLCLAVVLLTWRQHPTPPIVDSVAFSDVPPVSRPPAIAAAILAGGHATNAHAPGTIFDLAARNLLTVAEAEGNWRSRRRFVLTRNAGAGLAPHESALLDLMFREERTVDFAKAASRLARGGRAFRHAVNEELLRLGLTDDQRRVNRRRLLATGFFLGASSVAAAAIIVAIDLAPWGLAIPLGVFIAAILALLLGATRVELSDDGFREREHWRGFRRTLKASMRSTGPTGPAGSSSSIGSESIARRFLPYVAAMGLGAQFSRYLKNVGGEAILPPWFRTLAGTDGSAAFAAFVGTSASSTSGGAAGSGAAGGGSASAG